MALFSLFPLRRADAAGRKAERRLQQNEGETRVAFDWGPMRIFSGIKVMLGKMLAIISEGSNI